MERRHCCQLMEYFKHIYIVDMAVTTELTLLKFDYLNCENWILGL